MTLKRMLCCFAAVSIGLSGPAIAGGLANAATEPAMMPAQLDWSGAYIGGFVGGGSYAGTVNDQGGDALDTDGLVNRLDDFGGEIGLTAGYNVQRGSLVYGAEVDYAAISFAVSENFDDQAQQDAETSSLLSLRGRIGVAIDQSLIYGTVGYGLASVVGCATDEVGNCEPDNDDIVAFDDTLGGLVFGLGLEHRLSDALSVKLEYIQFESVWSDDIDYATEEAAEIARFSADHQAIRLGVNYHF